MNEELERSRFERHFMDQGAKFGDFKLAPDGHYNLNDVQQTWEGWKARAALESRTTQVLNKEGMTMATLDQLQRVDKRRLRAMALTAQILQIVGKYIPHNRDRDPMRDLTQELQDALEKAGAEIVSDFDRQQYGLSPRGPDGWTMEEIVESEKRRLDLMYAPMPPMIVRRS